MSPESPEQGCTFRDGTTGVRPRAGRGFPGYAPNNTPAPASQRPTLLLSCRLLGRGERRGTVVWGADRVGKMGRGGEMPAGAGNKRRCPGALGLRTEAVRTGSAGGIPSTQLLGFTVQQGGTLGEPSGGWRPRDTSSCFCPA